jgi:hypothetical protein
MLVRLAVSLPCVAVHERTLYSLASLNEAAALSRYASL